MELFAQPAIVFYPRRQRTYRQVLLRSLLLAAMVFGVLLLLTNLEVSADSTNPLLFMVPFVVAGIVGIPPLLKPIVHSIAFDPGTAAIVISYSRCSGATIERRIPYSAAVSELQLLRQRHGSFWRLTIQDLNGEDFVLTDAGSLLDRDKLRMLHQHIGSLRRSPDGSMLYFQKTLPDYASPWFSF